jgi:propanediol dehydratase large subunit
LGFPPVTDDEVEAATYAHGSHDMPPRKVTDDFKSIEEMMSRGVTGLDIASALHKTGFPDIAGNILNMLKQRVAGDYLHTSAIIDDKFNVICAVNNCNDYRGPGSGYRISPERWDEIKNIPQEIKPDDLKF